MTDPIPPASAAPPPTAPPRSAPPTEQIAPLKAAPPPPPSPAGIPPLGAEGRLRRAIVAISLCLCGSVPSFGLALSEFSLPGLILGVGTFAVVLVAISWSRWFRRRLRMPFVRRSLAIVYWGRVAISVAWPILIIADGVPGFVAISIVQSIGFTDPGSAEFSEVPSIMAMDGLVGTFVTVMVQGTLLNGILLSAAIGVWTVQRLFFSAEAGSAGVTFCRRCGYCRDGFPADHPCAECGDARPPLPWTPTWVDRWPLGRLVLLGFSLPVIIAAVAVGLLFRTGLP